MMSSSFSTSLSTFLRSSSLGFFCEACWLLPAPSPSSFVAPGTKAKGSSFFSHSEVRSRRSWFLSLWKAFTFSSWTLTSSSTKAPSSSSVQRSSTSSSLPPWSLPPSRSSCLSLS